jgi:DNA-binding IclR family transcriptional regulator
MSRNKVCSYTQNTITSPIHLRERLKLICARGYSVDDEEISEGLRCIGAPVWDYSNKVVAGVSIAGPSVRVTRRKVPELARHVVDAASRISKRLGFRTGTSEESTARAR